MEHHSMDWLHISAASARTAGSSFDASPERAIFCMIFCFRTQASFEVDSRSWDPTETDSTALEQSLGRAFVRVVS